MHATSSASLPSRHDQSSCKPTRLLLLHILYICARYISLAHYPFYRFRCGVIIQRVDGSCGLHLLAVATHWHTASLPRNSHTQNGVPQCTQHYPKAKSYPCWWKMPSNCVLAGYCDGLVLALLCVARTQKRACTKHAAISICLSVHQSHETWSFSSVRHTVLLISFFLSFVMLRNSRSCAAAAVSSAVNYLQHHHALRSNITRASVHLLSSFSGYYLFVPLYHLHLTVFHQNIPALSLSQFHIFRR